MAYKNNHYVPKLVLRRYNTEKLTVYDVDTGEVHEDVQLADAFSKKNLYGVEIEKLLGQTIESDFGSILSQKILRAEVGSEIELTRKELYVIKKFLLVEQSRIFMEDKEFYHTYGQMVAKMQSETYKYPFTEKVIEGETVKDRWLRTLRVIVECEDFSKIEQHELCTNEAYYWAQIYFSGYLAIWDCSGTDEEFIVTDVGMTSEREVGAPLGLEIKKKEYLYNKLLEEKDPKHRKLYSDLLYAQQSFHENFYMFSISKDRMLVIINPFFRLFDKSEKVPEPNIWPTRINKKLYAKNKAPNVASINGYPIYNEKDLFHYRVLRMSLDDLRWVNMLMLDRVQHFLGFSDIYKIADSVCDYRDFYRDVLKEQMRVDYNPLIQYMKDNDIID